MRLDVFMPLSPTAEKTPAPILGSGAESLSSNFETELSKWSQQHDSPLRPTVLPQQQTSIIQTSEHLLLSSKTINSSGMSTRDFDYDNAQKTSEISPTTPTVQIVVDEYPAEGLHDVSGTMKVVQAHSPKAANPTIKIEEEPTKKEMSEAHISIQKNIPIQPERTKYLDERKIEQQNNNSNGEENTAKENYFSFLQKIVPEIEKNIIGKSTENMLSLHVKRWDESTALVIIETPNNNSEIPSAIQAITSLEAALKLWDNNTENSKLPNHNNREQEFSTVDNILKNNFIATEKRDANYSDDINKTTEETVVPNAILEPVEKFPLKENTEQKTTSAVLDDMSSTFLVQNTATENLRRAQIHSNTSQYSINDSADVDINPIIASKIIDENPMRKSQNRVGNDGPALIHNQATPTPANDVEPLTDQRKDNNTILSGVQKQEIEYNDININNFEGKVQEKTIFPISKEVHYTNSKVSNNIPVQNSSEIDFQEQPDVNIAVFRKTPTIKFEEEYKPFEIPLQTTIAQIDKKAFLGLQNHEIDNSTIVSKEIAALYDEKKSKETISGNSIENSTDIKNEEKNQKSDINIDRNIYSTPVNANTVEINQYVIENAMLSEKENYIIVPSRKSEEKQQIFTEKDFGETEKNIPTLHNTNEQQWIQNQNEYSPEKSGLNSQLRSNNKIFDENTILAEVDVRTVPLSPANNIAIPVETVDEDAVLYHLKTPEIASKNTEKSVVSGFAAPIDAATINNIAAVDLFPLQTNLQSENDKVKVMSKVDNSSDPESDKVNITSIKNNLDVSVSSIKEFDALRPVATNPIRIDSITNIEKNDLSESTENLNAIDINTLLHYAEHREFQKHKKEIQNSVAEIAGSSISIIDEDIALSLVNPLLENVHISDAVDVLPKNVPAVDSESAIDESPHSSTQDEISANSSVSAQPNIYLDIPAKTENRGIGFPSIKAELGDNLVNVEDNDILSAELNQNYKSNNSSNNHEGEIRTEKNKFNSLNNIQSEIQVNSHEMPNIADAQIPSISEELNSTDTDEKSLTNTNTVETFIDNGSVVAKHTLDINVGATAQMEKEYRRVDGYGENSISEKSHLNHYAEKDRKKNLENEKFTINNVYIPEESLYSSNIDIPENTDEEETIPAKIALANTQFNSEKNDSLVDKDLIETFIGDKEKIKNPSRDFLEDGADYISTTYSDSAHKDNMALSESESTVIPKDILPAVDVFAKKLPNEHDVSAMQPKSESKDSNQIYEKELTNNSIHTVQPTQNVGDLREIEEANISNNYIPNSNVQDNIEPIGNNAVYENTENKNNKNIDSDVRSIKPLHIAPEQKESFSVSNAQYNNAPVGNNAVHENTENKNNKNIDVAVRSIKPLHIVPEQKESFSVPNAQYNNAPVDNNAVHENTENKNNKNIDSDVRSIKPLHIAPEQKESFSGNNASKVKVDNYSDSENAVDNFKNVDTTFFAEKNPFPTVQPSSAILQAPTQFALVASSKVFLVPQENTTNSTLVVDSLSAFEQEKITSVSSTVKQAIEQANATGISVRNIVMRINMSPEKQLRKNDVLPSQHSKSLIPNVSQEILSNVVQKEYSNEISETSRNTENISTPIFPTDSLQEDILFGKPNIVEIQRKQSMFEQNIGVHTVSEHFSAISSYSHEMQFVNENPTEFDKRTTVNQTESNSNTTDDNSEKESFQQSKESFQSAAKQIFEQSDNIFNEIQFSTSQPLSQENQISTVRTTDNISISSNINSPDLHVSGNSGAIQAENKIFANQITTFIPRALANNLTGMMRIILRPEALGSVTVQLNKRNDENILRLDVENIATKQLLESQLPMLREQLSKQGIVLEKAEIFVKNNDSFSQESKNDSSSQSHQSSSEQKQKEQESRQEFIRSFRYANEARTGERKEIPYSSRNGAFFRAVQQKMERYQSY